MSRLDGIARAVTLKPVHGAWFTTVFLFGIGFMFLIPPFQTNDETHHFTRLLSMPAWRGCREIPVEAEKLIEILTYKQIRLDGWKYQLRRLDAGLMLFEEGKRRLPARENFAACEYPATGYLVPALTSVVAARLWSIDRGKLMVRFYGARFGNWLTLSLCLLLTMYFVPSLRSWLLAAYSVPMVIHQSISINQDAAIFGLCALLCIPIFAERAWLKRGAAILAITLLLSQMKPVFWPFLGLLLVPLGEWLAEKRKHWRRFWTIAAAATALLLVVCIFFGRSLAVRGASTLEAPEWAKPGPQMEQLFDHPDVGWLALKAQLRDNLGHGHLVGGWTSILGVLGWCQHELPADFWDPLLLMLRVALLASLLAVVAGGARLGRSGTVVARLLPVWAPLLVILVIDFSFYLVFTPPGAPYVIGVQGRYYIGPLILFGALLAGWLGRGAAHFHHDWLPIQVARGALAVYGLTLAVKIQTMLWEVIGHLYYHEGHWGVTRPRWSVIAAFAVLPPLLAAPLYVVLGAPAWLSLVLGLVATAAAAVLISARLPPPTLARHKLLLSLGIAVAACAALYTRAYSGLPSGIGSDAGNHAALLRAADPRYYQGFVSMYLWWHVLEVFLRLDAFHALGVLFYAEVILMAVVPLAVAFVVLRRFEGTRAWTVGAAAAVAGLAGALGLVALPLVHYFQVEGFWSQIFALVPLLLLWWLDAALDGEWQRLLVWSAAVVAVRYTYGLNLIELLVAFATVMLLDAPRRFRLPAAALALVSLYAAYVAQGRFAAVFRQWGWFIGYDLVKAVGAGELALGALVVAALVVPVARAVRLPVMLAVGGFTIAVYYQHHFKPTYYLWKYPFQAVCLLALAACPMVGAVAAALVERRRPSLLVAGGGALALTVAALALWWSTFAVYHPSYQARLVGRPPPGLRPLVDLGAEERIDAVLAKEKKKFGAYLVGYPAMSNFMNSSRGVANGQKWYFEGRQPEMGAGWCVFWDGSEPETFTEFNRWYRHKSLVQRLRRDAKAHCDEYAAPWDPTLKRKICYLCR